MRTVYMVTLSILATLVVLLIPTIEAIAVQGTSDLGSQTHSLILSKSVPGQLNYQGFLADAADADHASTADRATSAQHAVRADTADHYPSAGAWTISGEYVYRETGKVGIGTTDLARELHVNDVLRLEPRATAPSSPSMGDIYVRSSDGKLMVYDGTTWQACW